MPGTALADRDGSSFEETTARFPPEKAQQTSLLGQQSIELVDTDLRPGLQCFATLEQFVLGSRKQGW